ncbi:MAG TPA: hypothetical protein VIJ60_02310 [Acidimicrobiales bacterium]
MSGDLVPEDAAGAPNEPGDPVGVLARAPAVDQIAELEHWTDTAVIRSRPERAVFDFLDQ